MKRGLKKVLAVGLSLFGTALAAYVGGSWLLSRPVRYLIVGFSAGTLTKGNLVICIVKIFFASTASGGIWCVFDIIAGKFREEEELIPEKKPRKLEKEE